MESENPHSRMNEIEVQLDLLAMAEAGTLDGIRCPKCHEFSLCVWFTRPSENEYRTWFVCDRCSYSVRSQNSRQPPYFSEDRVNKQLESYDVDVLSKRRIR